MVALILRFLEAPKASEVMAMPGDGDARHDQFPCVSEPADWPSDELDEDTLEVPPDEVDVDRANRFVASPALLSPTRQAAP
ncbi:unnamed protein product, partial [Prorocentrum cordatum]